MTAASNSEARKRLADPTPRTDPTAAAVRAAQAEALREAADEFALNNRFISGNFADWLRDRADRLATDTAAPEAHRRRHSRCGLGDPDMCGHPECPDMTAAPVAVEGVETVETLAEVRLTEAEQSRLRDAVKSSHEAMLFVCVERIIAARIVQARAGEGALRERYDALVAVHASYFDLDGEPGLDDTTPEPEDVWRYDRDLRAALDPEATT